MLALPIICMAIFSPSYSTCIFFLISSTSYIHIHTYEYTIIHLPEYVSKRTPFLNRCRWNISLTQLSLFFLLLQMYVISSIFTLIQFILLLCRKGSYCNLTNLNLLVENRHSIIFQKCKYSGGEISTLTPKKPYICSRL